MQCIVLKEWDPWLQWAKLLILLKLSEGVSIIDAFHHKIPYNGGMESSHGPIPPSYRTRHYNSNWAVAAGMAPLQSCSTFKDTLSSPAFNWDAGPRHHPLQAQDREGQTTSSKTRLEMWPGSSRRQAPGSGKRRMVE